VLDSWAVLAFFQDEAGAEQVERLLVAGRKGRVGLIMSVVNLGEVWYAVARAGSPGRADEKVAQLMALPIEVVPADWSLTLAAARLKARGRVAYADCFTAALAIARDARLVTGDREFEVFGGDIRVEWL
jgi:ribonuclease VapC